MSFIYDLMLNFNEQYYEFYEWDEEDNYSLIKRMPIFKTTTNVTNNIKCSSFIIEPNFLNIIKNKSELVDNGIIKTINYACLFASTKDVVAVVFDENGHKVLSSSLLIDEEIDSINKSRKLPIIKLNYQHEDKTKQKKFHTRREQEIVYLLETEIVKMYESKKIDKLKYLYYECFFKLIENIDIIYKELLAMINSDFSETHMRLYRIVKLSISS